MDEVYGPKDYQWIQELTAYPRTLEERLAFFDDTSQIVLPTDPVEQVVFQTRAKEAIRKIAQNKGHILMVGRPGTGKSMLASMFKQVLEKSLGDYLAPRETIVAYPGKDANHIRIAYEHPNKIDRLIGDVNSKIETAGEELGLFSLDEQITGVRRVKKILLGCAFVSGAAGLLFPPAFILTGLAGMGAIFMFMQENNHRVQEKIQREARAGTKNSVKHLTDMVPAILYDPREDGDLMARVSEPDARNMKGGFRHDPYQSGNLQTPTHKRAYLGAHAKAPIIYMDELKTLVKAGYMSDLLEIMQDKRYLLEGGRNTGSGAADRSENHLKADNIIVACCNHDTLQYLQKEGDGAFLSRIEDKGEIVQMESSVAETPHHIRQVAQYVKQEIDNLGCEFKTTWGAIKAKEGFEGVRRRSQHLIGKPLPPGFRLQERDFNRTAILEIIKELRCRAGDGRLSSILRPINGIIKTAEFNAMLDDAPLVTAEHVRQALAEHLSLEGEMARELGRRKKDLKKYISSMTDAIGYVVGLAVIESRASGQMVGQPLPIHGQINAGGSDQVIAPGIMGEIAKGAAQNVRASIKKVLAQIGAPYVGYEMHVEYIQAHGGVEGDSASAALDVALISDFIRQPVNQKFGVTGSLTGDIILAVGGVTVKIRSIMDRELGMEGACIPWQNKHDVEPLLINTQFEYRRQHDIPAIRIYRQPDRKAPFDIYFCKTKYNVYRIVMGLDRTEVENRMVDRSQADIRSVKKKGKRSQGTASAAFPGT